jgi:hypothetical protein
MEREDDMFRSVSHHVKHIVRGARLLEALGEKVISCCGLGGGSTDNWRRLWKQAGSRAVQAPLPLLPDREGAGPDFGG